MNARMRNAMRAMVAAAVMTMSATTMASAVQPNGLPRDNRVAARTVAVYGEGSWLTPLAVVLDSKQAWDEWNCQAVANGWAVAVEPAPKNVDWRREAVLVVALGENLNATQSVTLSTCKKSASKTTVSLECALNSGGSAPALVVALPRSAARNVTLDSNLMMPDMPTSATYVMASTAGAATPVAMATTWGALKADYR